MITEHLLTSFQARKKAFEKGQVIFYEQSTPFYYFQVASGKVGMLCFQEDGKSFIQGIFEQGDSFGEPPLIGEFPYPTRAVALKECEVWLLPKQGFLEILKANPGLNLYFTKILCQRIEQKATLLKTLCIKNPRKRILSFLNSKNTGKLLKQTQDGHYILPLTRQQLADSLSLRVETVIRALKDLEREGKIAFLGRKVCIQ